MYAILSFFVLLIGYFAIMWFWGAVYLNTKLNDCGPLFILPMMLSMFAWNYWCEKHLALNPEPSYKCSSGSTSCNPHAG
jgi:hypothetical protein